MNVLIKGTQSKHNLIILYEDMHIHKNTRDYSQMIQDAFTIKTEFISWKLKYKYQLYEALVT